MGQILSLSELWAAFRRQVPLMLMLLIIGLPLAYGYAMTRPAAYQAIAMVVIEGPPNGESQGDPGLSSRLTEIEQTVLSRGRISEFARRLALFPETENQELRLELTREAVTISRLGEDPFQGRRPTGLSIAVRMEDPEKAAAFANALAEGIIAEDTRRARIRLDASIARASEAHNYLSGEQLRVEGEIRTLEAQIAEFRKTYSGSLPENIEDQRERRLELERSRILIDREIAYYEQANSAFRTAVTERHRAGLQAELDSVLAELAGIESALQLAPEVERQMAEFERGLQNFESELAALTTTRTQVAIDQRLRGQEEHRLAMSDYAVTPQFPVSRDRRKIAVAAGMVVVALAAGIAALREFLQPAIRTAAQMRRQLDIEPVVVIPFIRSRKRPMRRLVHAGVFIGVLLLVILAGAAATTGSTGASPRLDPTGSTQ